MAVASWLLWERMATLTWARLLVPDAANVTEFETASAPAAAALALPTREKVLVAKKTTGHSPLPATVRVK